MFSSLGAANMNSAFEGLLFSLSLSRDGKCSNKLIFFSKHFNIDRREERNGDVEGMKDEEET